jgi:hypothetical protein
MLVKKTLNQTNYYFCRYDSIYVCILYEEMVRLIETLRHVCSL